MEFVALFCFLDVEFGREGKDGFELAVDVAESFFFVFVEGAEYGGEFLGEAWEEGHFWW